MLFQHVDRLGAADLLLMDRGSPCRWLVALLNARTIPFCMRVERAGNAGFACVRDFLRSGLEEQVVDLPAPDMRDTVDYECPATPQKVRLVRHVASTGKARVLMTNLLDTVAYPRALFGELYHYRWRIEEAFKRLKHRLNLVQALAAAAAASSAGLPQERRINRAYAHTVLKPLFPALLLGSLAIQAFEQALNLIDRQNYRHPSVLMRY